MAHGQDKLMSEYGVKVTHEQMLDPMLTQQLCI